VVHRDVKPQNVLLDEEQRVYLADFGIARMVEGSSTLTATGMISGTPHYMAPEQALGRAVDHRADIYALGVMAYQMLLGQVPFEADTPVAVLLKHASQPMPLPSPDELPEPAARALLKCLAKQPEDRWPTAGSFVQALAAGLGEAPPAEQAPPFATATLSVPATPPAGRTGAIPAPEPAAPTAVAARRHAPRRALVWGAVLALAGAGAVLGVLTYFFMRRGSQAPTPNPTAQAVVATPELGGGPSALLVTPAPPKARAQGTATARPRAAAAEPDRAQPDRTEPDAAEPAAPEPGDAGFTATDGPTRLALDFQHPLERGTLRLWLDDRLLMTQQLDAESTRNVVGLRLRKGSIEQVLEVPPGRHTVRVEVAWDDNRKSRTITGTFPAGGVRRLEARLGRLRKNLSLDWN
jgi:serine/threonine-protein kinase